MDNSGSIYPDESDDTRLVADFEVEHIGDDEGYGLCIHMTNGEEVRLDEEECWRAFDTGPTPDGEGGVEFAYLTVDIVEEWAQTQWA